MQELVGKGDELHSEFEPTPHGWVRLVLPLLLFMMRREERATMGHLRDVVERRTAARE